MELDTDLNDDYGIPDNWMSDWSFEWYFDPPEGADIPFDPWAGFEELGDVQCQVTSFWESLEEDPPWEDMIVPEGYDTAWDYYSTLFDPYQDFYGEREEWLIGEAATDIDQAIVAFNLEQSQLLESYNFGRTAAGEVYDLQTGQAVEAWELAESGYTSQLQGLETMLGLTQEDITRRGTEAETMWGLQSGSLTSQIGEAEDIYTLKAEELDRMGIAASDLWSLSKGNLLALGIDAQDIWAIEKADIERRKIAGTTMWGLESTALQEPWGTEKEGLGYATQLGLEQVQKGESNAIMAMGFANAPTGFDEAGRRVREEYSMNLTAGENRLTNQLLIGTENLVQLQAGLNADIYRGDESLGNLLDSYSRDIEVGELKLSQDLDGFVAQ